MEATQVNQPSSGHPVICIAGAGFSGVAVACQLLKTLRQPTNLLLVNEHRHVGRGLAYGTPSPHHVLNVPAGRMGLYADDEGGFLRYLEQLGLPFSGGDFVPRSLYGAYLEYSLGEAIAEGRKKGVRLSLIQQDRVELLQPVGADGFEVSLKGGRSLHATAVVLALGNFPARAPWKPTDDRASDAGNVNSAWDGEGLATHDVEGDVLLIGSGLTAFDALLELRHRGHRGQIHMLSRRGLLAQYHRPNETPPAKGVVPSDFLDGCGSARTMLRQVRELCRLAAANGNDWRDVIGGLRQRTPALWAQLPEAERRRFLRHVLPYWDTHRHRAAVSIGRRIDQELAEGSLRVSAGRLLSVHRQEHEWLVEIQPRGTTQRHQRRYAAVVNCTGPSSDLTQVNDSLIRSLLDKGMIQPDNLHLGLQVDADYRVRQRAPGARLDLFYVGPLLKAQLWEATAVPELRQHAQRLAQEIGHTLYPKAP